MNSRIHQARRAAPVATHSSLVANALIDGGDQRLALSPVTLLNPYGCQAYPRPGELSFASSTASTISERAFAAAEATFSALALDQPGRLLEQVAELSDGVRNRLKSLFDLNASDEVIIAPSGTDAVLLALSLAQRTLGKPTLSLLAAADESGSGVALAASGRHFASSASGGRQVTKGDAVAGFAADTEVRAIRGRDNFGNPRPRHEVDQEIVRHVEDGIRRGYGIVLYAMDHSKTGLRYPSQACLRQLASAYGNDVQIVVDACQVRLGRERIQDCLRAGWMVLLTGSKFFAGPPLSGALLVPQQVALRMGKSGLHEGLSDYTAKSDWPEKIVARQNLPSRANVGQLLRWTAALEDMSAYFSVPSLARKVMLAEAAATIDRKIRSYANVNLLELDASEESCDGASEFEHRTIYSFTVRRGSGLHMPSVCRTLYHALNTDMSDLLHLRGAEAELAATPCHIGQPVTLCDGANGEAGALRISIDGRMITELWASRDSGQHWQDQIAGSIRTVMDKLQLLTERWETIEKLPFSAG